MPIGPRCDLCDLAKISPSLCPSKEVVAVKRTNSASPLKIRSAVKKSEGEEETEDLYKPKIEVQVEVGEGEPEVEASKQEKGREEKVIKPEPIVW